MAEVVVLGSLNMDLSIQVPRIPLPGETIQGGDLLTNAGGKGANQAVACAKMGRRVTMIGCVGKDNFGESLKDGLREYGVNVDLVAESEAAPTGTAMIMVDSKGENCIVLSMGANRLPVINAKAEKKIRQCRMLILQLEIPLEIVCRAVEIASNAGVPVLLNPAPAGTLPSEILSKVDYLVPNETEAAQLTGIEIKDEKTAIKAAQKLLGLGTKNVILTRGALGALLVNKNDTINTPAFTVFAVDTTGAGDAFIGGLASALVEGKDLPTALQYASAAGALASTKPGAQSSLPTRQEVESFLQISKMMKEVT